jgi:hypothetical protein
VVSEELTLEHWTINGVQGPNSRVKNQTQQRRFEDEGRWITCLVAITRQMAHWFPDGAIEFLKKSQADPQTRMLIAKEEFL